MLDYNRLSQNELLLMNGWTTSYKVDAKELLNRYETSLQMPIKNIFPICIDIVGSLNGIIIKNPYPELGFLNLIFLIMTLQMLPS